MPGRKPRYDRSKQLTQAEIENRVNKAGNDSDTYIFDVVLKYLAENDNKL